MYEFKNGTMIDREDERPEPKVTVSNFDEIKPLDEEMYLPLSEYKRLLTAEVLLRVVLAEDSDVYGSSSRTVEAARKVYAEIVTEEKEIKNDAE